MQKIIVKIIILSILLIGGCDNQEEMTVKLDKSKENENISENPNILDAVIDTEAEKNYIKNIEKKYSLIKNEYEKNMTTISSMVGEKQSSMGIMVKERRFLEEAIKQMNLNREEMNKIYMPIELKNMINICINMKIESYQSEIQTIKNIEGNINNEEQRKESYEKYQKVKDQNMEITNYFISVLE